MSSELEHTDLAAVELLAGSLLRLPYETWNFGDSVAFEALVKASVVLGDRSYQSFAHGWARSWTTRSQPFRRLDCTAPGHAMVGLATSFDDSLLMNALVELADYLMARPTIDGVYATWEHSPLREPYGGELLGPHDSALLATPPAGAFLDCLHFDPPFLTALGQATGAEKYWQAGLVQAEGYLRLLQRADGLLDHFVLVGEPSSFGPGWGRGQGWALLGLLDTVEGLRSLATDVDARQRVRALSDAAARLVAAMVLHQRRDGHWNAVVDDPLSGLESSTAAFMAAGFARAVALGVVASDAVEQPTRRARQAVRGSIGADGTLQNVSVAVMACTRASHYSHVPRGFLVPWGQGPALLALAGGGPS